MKKETKKSIPFIVVAVIFVGIIGFLIVDSVDTSPIEYSQGVLSISEDFFDFSTTSMADGNVSHDFEIKNDSKENVLIENIFTSCACTTATLTTSDGKKYGTFGMHEKDDLDIEIESGDSAILTVIFDPAAHGPSAVGKVRRTVYINTNSQEKPKFQISVQADVIR